LPGIGNFGYIKLNNISKVYSDLLKNAHDNKKQADGSNSVNTLLGMYNKGDLLRCKVLSYTDKKLYLSIEPDQVNSGLTFNNLEEDMVI
jgi:exosome complex RNA-binding protein Csl4